MVFTVRPSPPIQFPATLNRLTQVVPVKLEEEIGESKIQLKMKTVVFLLQSVMNSLRFDLVRSDLAMKPEGGESGYESSGRGRRDGWMKLAV